MPFISLGICGKPVSEDRYILDRLCTGQLDETRDAAQSRYNPQTG